MSKIKYRPEVDGLRAVAILSVLIYHFFPSAMPGGLVGVDIFFVISGYLINKTLVANHVARTHSIRDFYVRRILRIFPALLLMFWAVFLFGWISLYADEYKELGLHIASGAGFFSNITYLNESGYFDRSSELKPLLHLWSLGVEEQFYLVWPLALLFILTLQRPVRAIWGLALLSFVACVFVSYRNADYAYYLPMTRFWEILLGAVIAAQERSGKAEHLGARKSVFGLFLILVSIFWVDGSANFPGWQALFPVLGAYFIIRNSAGGHAHRILSNKWMVGIGLISYPLYIWHWPVLAFLKITELTPGVGVKIAAIAVVTLLSVLTYRYVETPVRMAKRKNRAALVLLGMMVFTGLIGVYTYHREGMDFREVNYVVYKNTVKERVSVFLGLQSQPQVLTTNQYLDPARFEAGDPSYTANLKQLIETMRSQGNLATIKKDFDAINKEGFRCDDARCGQGKTGQTIVVIGDSHAENFYFALADTHRMFNIVRFTDSGCTPIASRYRDPENRCNRVLKQADDYLQTNQVALVILAARWPQNFEDVASDVAHYRAKAGNVAIAGPSIIFSNELAQILLRYDGAMEVNAYINSHLDFERFSLNDRMKQFSAQAGIPYIDRIAPLCGEGLCRLTRSGRELFIFDNGHLTTAGARYVGEWLLRDGVIERLVYPGQTGTNRDVVGRN